MMIMKRRRSKTKREKVSNLTMMCVVPASHAHPAQVCNPPPFLDPYYIRHSIFLLHYVSDFKNNHTHKQKKVIL